MQAVAYPNDQLYDADASVAFVDADLVDAGVGDGDAGGELGNDAALVFQFDAQLDGKFATDVLVPRQVQGLLAVMAVIRGGSPAASRCCRRCCRG